MLEGRFRRPRRRRRHNPSMAVQNSSPHFFLRTLTANWFHQTWELHCYLVVAASGGKDCQPASN
jgi:hypothetical protein